VHARGRPTIHGQIPSGDAAMRPPKPRARHAARESLTPSLHQAASPPRKAFGVSAPRDFCDSRGIGRVSRRSKTDQGEAASRDGLPAFNRLGDGPPLFVVLPRFASAQDRFAVYHRSRLHGTPSPSGCVSEPVFCKCAQPFCERVDACRAERGWRADRAVLFLAPAPTWETPAPCYSLHNAM
jgi:hypothetical protein